MPKPDILIAYVAGVLSAAALAYMFWQSQVPPPSQ